MRLGPGLNRVGNMSDEDRYRRHARFCREQALPLHGGPESEQWNHLADDYERLADGRALDTQQQQPQPKKPDEK